MVVILDTDPGVDDVLALLLLLRQPRAALELRLISLTAGNTSLQSALRNALSVLHVLGLENAARAARGAAPVSDQRPTVALGVSGPLAAAEAAAAAGGAAQAPDIDAEDVHGSDGLGGVHAAHPEFSARAEWLRLFAAERAADAPAAADPAAAAADPSLPFAVAAVPAWDAINDVLRAEPADTVTIIAVGPLGNLARAAAADPAAFARVKQVLVMGGAVREPGNVTPVAEFNFFADPVAAARVLALTSARPADTLPPGSPAALAAPLPRRPLTLRLFPLDLTNRHVVTRAELDGVLAAADARAPGSPLARWVQAFMHLSFANYARLLHVEVQAVQLHDPLTAAYAVWPQGALAAAGAAAAGAAAAGAWAEQVYDLRVETAGQWSAGQSVADLRGRARRDDNPHDFQKWLTTDAGNRVAVVTASPFEERFGKVLFEEITRA